MGDDKAELEKLIEQAQEMVGAEGRLRLTWDYPPEITSFSSGERMSRGWGAVLRTNGGLEAVSRGAMPTPEEALRAGIAALVERAGRQKDEAQRLLHIARGDHD